ncbi:hypothetical protein N802_08720 [Knoellia sinensis KCTC 19936]|uniref:Arylsulfatase n=1 Tax=Knoellia sinensis KCTC 19936 TaxID=1385520 RepID=A0A0A0J8U9_9MICO|nr:hypothetical protein [Knoellia sinensis]KGN33865.1 hypothetical protein N802_08720 [Knoellia sinensis KCTC 19936]
MGTIGYLHTSPVHVPTFDRLTRGADAAVKALHLVDEGALATARAGDPQDVAELVARQVKNLADGGAEVIVCTCSTIGGVAESVGPQVFSGSVLRVDRPMARRAVAQGSRVGVVAALESTVQPTVELLREEAAAADREIDVVVEVAEGAWAHFEAGDHAAYLAVVAASARSMAMRADVVVLAQASMMGALDLLAEVVTPVLASPPAAVAHALDLL